MRKVRELLGKLFIVNIKFGAKSVYSLFPQVLHCPISGYFCFLNHCDHFCTQIYSIRIALTITCIVLDIGSVGVPQRLVTL